MLAICRCYDRKRWQFTLVSYIPYLKNRKLSDVDLVDRLIHYREHPTEVLNVNKYALGEMGRFLRRLGRIRDGQ